MHAESNNRGTAFKIVGLHTVYDLKVLSSVKIKNTNYCIGTYKRKTKSYKYKIEILLKINKVLNKTDALYLYSFLYDKIKDKLACSSPSFRTISKVVIINILTNEEIADVNVVFN